jgi:MoaA/NifB/PqqE/SkfB family radical SAM enzyme
MSTKIKPEEKQKRNKLEKEKPLVYEKIKKFENMVKGGKSIAIVRVEHSYQCNFSCEHCCITELRQPGVKPAMMEIENIKNLADQADAYGLARWVITGGEPLVFENLEEIVNAIGPKRFFIACDTNGWFLDDEKAKYLKKIGVDKVQISIDGSCPEVHDKFRRKEGSHERTMRAIDASLKAGLSVIVQTVAISQRLRSGEFKDFLKLINSKGVGVYISFGKPVGAWKGEFGSLITKADLEYVEELEKKYNVFTHLTPSYGMKGSCIAGCGMVSITAGGEVTPCPYMHISMGNVLDEPLDKILERTMKNKYFGGKVNVCMMAESDENGGCGEFLERYIVGKVYPEEKLPVSYKKVFTREDFSK